MLNEQHIPLSVGKDLKISEQGISIPFHSQYLRIDLLLFSVEVKFFKSKQGKLVYHKAENIGLSTYVKILMPIIFKDITSRFYLFSNLDY